MSDKVDMLKSKIFKWLDEEGYKVRDVLDANSNFALLAEFPNGIMISIIQPKTSSDRVFIITKFNLTQAQQSTLTALDREKREEIFQDLLLGLIQLRVECNSLSIPLDLQLYKSIYKDGFNKNLFMCALLDVYNAQWFIGISVARKLSLPSADISLSHIYE